MPSKTASGGALGFDPRDKQLGLFGAAVPVGRVAVSGNMSFEAARRTGLDAGSWVEHVPGWLQTHRSLFEQLLSEPSWAQRERWMFDKFVTEPRLTAEYPNAADAPLALRECCT